MKVKREYIDILKLFIEKKTNLSLNEIMSNLKYKLEPRTLQRHIKELITLRRLVSYGSASSTTYRLRSPEEIMDFFAYVYKNKRYAGVVGFSASLEKFIFSYDVHYLFSEPIEIIPTLDTPFALIESTELFPVFEELLPEGIDRQALEYQEKTSSVIALLLALEQNVGDLSFSKEKSVLTPDSDVGIFYHTHKKEILGSHNFPNVLALDMKIDTEKLFIKDIAKATQPSVQFGLSGQQHKMHVIMDEANKILREPHKSEPTYYFIKPYNKDYTDPQAQKYIPYLSVNEHLHMSFAKNELGFDVPWSAIIKDGEDWHYIIKRFDKYQNSVFAKTNVSSLMGLNSETKYDTSTEKMAQRVAKELLDKKERMIFLHYLFYSLLIVHEDMHTKNLSIMYTKNRSFMSPLYDVATTVLYDSCYGYESHLTINGKQQNIRPNDFKVICQKLDVSFSDFLRLARETALIYADKMPYYIERLKTLGSMPFFTRKPISSYSKDKRVLKEEMEFSDILEKKFFERVEKLKEFGWLVV